MANNRIPRNAKKIYITWLIDTSATRTGDRDTVERIDNKWIGTSATGATYSMPVSILRNANVVQVDQIETDEPNNRKDVLLSDIGTQVYIIDGASRTDKAAQAVITALCNSGRITGELAERARNDRPTLDKIKRNLLHVQMEERETETGMRWTFYTESGVYMDISAYSRNYIRADKQGDLYPVEDPTTEETSTTGPDAACTDKEPQEGAETAQKTADDTTTAGSDTDHTEASQDAQKATQTEGTTAGWETIAQEGNEPQRATETPRKTIQTGERLYSHPHRHMVTVEGLQGELVRVIYKGRLYLVCSSDLYTDETETTPAMLPPQAAESAEKTADDTTPTAGDTTPTEGTQEAPQTAGTSEGAETTIPPHTEPPRATERATTADGEQATTAAAPTPYNDKLTANKMTGSHAGPAKEMTAERSERRKRYLQRMIDELAKKRRKARRDAKEMTSTTPPRHACQNAPGRTERAQAEQVPTNATKSPPRATQKARHTTGGSRGHPEKCTFSVRMQKSGSDPPKI